MTYHLIDTHCHITCDALYERINEIFHNAHTHHVDRMLVVCTNFEEYERAQFEKDRGYPIDIALGFHPNDLLHFHEEDYVRLEELLRRDALFALGEIGLDYHYDDVSKAKQRECFIRQIELAKAYDKAVLIHMREATLDTLDILKRYAPSKGIMHCYSGSYETAMELIHLGYYISYGGPLTFKNARGAPDVAMRLPIDRLLIETDCPYLTPHPFRGKQNEPMYLEYTFEKLCELKNLGKSELSVILQNNYERLFAHTDTQHRGEV